MSEQEETVRQKFIRNTGETTRILKMQANRLRDGGDVELAELVDKVVAGMNELLKKAVDMEAGR